VSQAILPDSKSIYEPNNITPFFTLDLDGDDGGRILRSEVNWDIIF